MMEGYDVLSDSYSSEMIIVLVLERLWTRIQSYLKSRDEKAESDGVIAKVDDRDKEHDKQLHEIAKTLSEIKGKQSFFENYLNKKL